MRARKALALVVALSLALPVRAEEPELAPLPAQQTAKGKSKPPPWLRKNRQGTLLLKSKTRGAVVQVDGLEVGSVPLGPLQLPPGPHEVRLSKPGFRDLSQRVTVRAGKKVVLSLDLSRPRGGIQPLAKTPAAPELPGLPALPAPGAPSAEKLAAAPQKPAADSTAPMVAPPPAPVAKLAEPAPVAPPTPVPLPSLPELPPPPLVVAEARPPALPPTAPAAATTRRPAVPMEAVTAPREAEAPLTSRWYFWGGAAAVVAVVAAGVVYALPARYVEKRDPAAACGGAQCVVVNK